MGYTEDTMLFCCSMAELREGVHSACSINKEATRLGLRDKWSRTKLMHVGGESDPLPIIIGSYPIEVVMYFVYIVSEFSNTIDLLMEINKRHELAAGVMRPLKATMEASQHLPVHQVTSLQHHHPLCATIQHWNVASQQDHHLPRPWLRVQYTKDHWDGALVRSCAQRRHPPEDWLAEHTLYHCSAPCPLVRSHAATTWWLPHQSHLPVRLVICRLKMILRQITQPLEGRRRPGAPADQSGAEGCPNVLLRMWELVEGKVYLVG